VALVGQGLVASTFCLGLHRIKGGRAGLEGVPLSDELPVKVEEVEVCLSIDVDSSKVGRSLSEVVSGYFPGEGLGGGEFERVEVRRGLHLGSTHGLPIEGVGLEEMYPLERALDELEETLLEADPDAIVLVSTTERFKPFGSREELEDSLKSGDSSRFSAAQLYLVAAARYARRRGGAALVNGIPTSIANDPVLLGLAEESGLVVFGDDGATGATPLTADLLSHMLQRNRRVLDVAQFNIGGNMDFLALSDEGRNRSKQETKSSVVKDILGYDAPHYIRPTGYLEPLGDRKFVAMHMEYVSFGGAIDELVVTARINDSPALAGMLVDLVRLAKMALDRGLRGTVYEVNAFYSKNPGPKGSKNIPRTVAYERLRRWAGLKPRWL